MTTGAGPPPALLTAYRKEISRSLIAMDPVSVGLFVVMAVVIVFLVAEVRDHRKELNVLNKLVPEVAAKCADKADASRFIALEIENRTIKADIEELKARRRSEVRPTSSAGAMKKFRAEMRGAEIEG